jgi:hypothetical protein
MVLCQAVVVVMFVLGVPAIVHGAVTGWTDVVVRVYDANREMAGTNHAALDFAGKTLEAASIEVVWRLCATPRTCDAPMAPGELAIRIVRLPGPRRYQGMLPLGDALLHPEHGGVLATIYIDRVEWMAHEAGTDRRALLGHAIAHELGHLLLATTSHGPVGLMRAFWSRDEVRQGRRRDWTFASSELARLRRRLEAQASASIIR